jgi:hypothetical protein
MMKHWLIISCVAGAAAGGVWGAGELDNLPFCGISADYHLRRGYLDFGNGYTEEIRRSAIPAIGVLLGKRWRLLPWARLEMSATVKYGAATEDSLPPIMLSDNTMQNTLIKTSFFYGSFTADFQLPFHVAPDGQLFLHGGFGGHVAEAWESEVLSNNTSQRVTDLYLEDHTTWSASVHGGLGFEIAITPLFGFAASYSLRYWYPIRFGMFRDIFPTAPVDYSERFITHQLDIIFLVKR